jgi:putative nucleotidyltransferase with HDIG domain
MTEKDLHFMKEWFSGYTKSFFSSVDKEQKNISLKVQHTANVCEIIVKIADSLSLKKNQVLTAEAVALFHDIGRFPQYARYKTFRDHISVNHGRLGAEVLREEKVLREIPHEEQELIIDSVNFHNAYALPQLHDTDRTFFLKLIRDADKLDIWRVFLEFYEGQEDERASEAGLGLPDRPGYSREVISAVLEKRTASLSTLKTMNDFKLMQLSWVYDLNFIPSVRLLVERGYIERLVALLPRNNEIAGVSKILREFSENRLKGE